MNNKKMQVFVSSTYTDLRDERQAAVEAILTAGHIPAGMELFAAGDQSQLDTIKRWIRDSDIFMLILGARYGSIEPESEKSYVQIEYEYALELGMPVFAAVMHDDYRRSRVKRDGEDILELKFPEQYADFRGTVLSKITRFYESVGEVKLIVHESLPSLIRDREMDGWIRGADAKTVQDVEERRELEQQVRDLEEQLNSLKLTDESSAEEFAAGEEVIRLPFESDAGNGEVEVTWDDLFRIAGKASLHNPGIAHIRAAVSYYIASVHHPAIDGVRGRITDDDFSTIQSQFVALQYVSIESAYQQEAASEDPFIGSLPACWVTGWRLTDRGQRKLAELIAIRRAQPSTT